MSEIPLDPQRPASASASIEAGDLDTPAQRRLPDRLLTGLSNAAFWNAAPLRWFTIALAAVLFYLVVVVPLEFASQVGLALAFFVLAMFMRRQRSHIATLVMMVLSLIVSSRYMFWRLTE